MLAGLCFASLSGLVSGQKTGYVIQDFELVTEPTIDGTWTTTDEWTDAAEAQLDGDIDAIFRIKHSTEAGTGNILYYYILVEVLDDSTNDPGDLTQICIVGADEVGGTPDGAYLPQTNCIRFDYDGNDAGGFTCYRGNGATWSTQTGYTWSTDVFMVNSFDTSPSSDTTHRIAELKISAEAFDINPEYWLRVAVFDESNPVEGVPSWPYGSRDNTNDWGKVEVSAEAIPEFPAWILLPMFATATLAVTFWRKRLTTSETKI